MKNTGIKGSLNGTDYNNIAREYNKTEKDAVTLWHLGYENLIRHLKPVNKKLVLDYGCGSGTFCRFLRTNDASVTGVDISEDMIRVAKQTFPCDISYIHITSETLDFLEDESFDKVVANFVFCTISSPEKIIKIMRSLKRVLKKSGSFIILNTNWDKSNGKEFISFKLQYCNNLTSGKPVKAVIKNDPPIILYDYFWSKADYAGFLEEAGFQIKGIYEPLAKRNGIPWIAEKSFPPYHIIEAIR